MIIKDCPPLLLSAAAARGYNESSTWHLTQHAGLWAQMFKMHALFNVRWTLRGRGRVLHFRMTIYFSRHMQQSGEYGGKHQ